MLAFGLVAAAFPYGPLFPWSPVKPGYEKAVFARADVYYPAGAALDEAYRTIDDSVAHAEQFHRLRLHGRVKVIACRDWSDFHRMLPVIQGRGVGAATLETGTVIYVTPKLDEAHLDKREFLRHELSHAVLNQNASLWRSHRMGPHAWFYEGIAVACGAQQSYDSAEQFRAKARALDLTRVIGGRLATLPEPRDMRFLYPAWRYFLEYRIADGGRDKFQGLIDAFRADPDAIREDYQRIYGEPIEATVRRFQASLR